MKLPHRYLPRGRQDLIAAILAAAIGVSGCAYFNTLYNAKKLFAEAELIPRGKDGLAGSSAKQKYDESIKKCEALIVTYPKSKYVDDAVLLIGKCLYEKGEYTDAIERFTQLDSISTDRELKAEGRTYRAKSYVAKGDTEEAIPIFQAIVDENPKRASDETLFYLGTALVRMGEEDLAVKYLEQLAGNYPRSPYRLRADLEAAELYAERKDYERSLSVYDRLRNLAMGPEETIRYLSNFAAVYAETARFQEAIEVLRRLQSYAVDPTQKASNLLVAGKAYTGLDSLPVAIEKYRTVAGSYPKSEFSAEAYYRLGQIYQEKLDSLQVAQGQFDKVAGEYASSRYSSDALARSSAIGKLLRLRATLESGNQEDPARVQFDLAEIELFQFKNYEKAAEAYRKIIDENPTSELAPKAAYALAYIYEVHLGDDAKALEAYGFVVSRYPDTQQAQFAREAVERMQARGEP
jgi:TolA-binding protein